MTNLRPLPTKPATPPTDPAYYIAAGNYNRPDFPLLTGTPKFCRRHIAHHLVPRLVANEPPRIAVLQGIPGDGKTETLKVTLSRAGVAMIFVPGSHFAGPHEDSAISALNEIADDIARISQRTCEPFALVIDDADLSILNMTDNVTYTVNSQGFINQMMHLANGTDMRDAQGRLVPIFMTGNDFSTLRASQLRPGRAVFHTHAPSFDDKVEIAAQLFRTFGFSPADMRTLISDHPSQPVAFFSDLRTAIYDAQLDAALNTHGLHPLALDRAVATPPRLTIGQLRAVAHELATARARNFLAA